MGVLVGHSLVCGLFERLHDDSILLERVSCVQPINVPLEEVDLLLCPEYPH